MSKIRRIKLFFIFLFQSRTIFQAHSPFLFELIETCFNKKINNNNTVGDIEHLRKKMRKCNTGIDITDFGVSSNRKTKIKKIAKSSLTSKKRSEIIYHIIKNFSCKTVIELGTNLGINTLYMGLANKGVEVYSIEGCENIYKIAQENIIESELENIKLINNTFENSLPQLLDSLKTFDLIYIDGNHSYEATINYFNLCLKHKHIDSIILFDDICWSEGMQRAWQEIIQSNEVTLTVNYFYSGLVFFKKELSKDNFILRYKNFFKIR